MESEVTNTCYPEAQALSRIIKGIQEIEFNKQGATQKEKLTGMSKNIYPELAVLVMTKTNLIQTGRSERTLKERYLEAVSYGWKTVKEVCLQVHSGVNECSREKERALKSTSMFLMRLYKANLVYRRLGKTGFEYCLSVKGLKRLLFYGYEAARIERKRILHEQMKKCVKLNDEIVPEIEQMRAYNAEAMKKLQYGGAAEAVYQTYSNIVREFTLQITELQRAIINGDDNSHINVLVQSTKSLLQLVKVETDMFDVWRTILEEQKWLNGQVRKADLELKRLLEHDQHQAMSQAKKKVWNAGLLRDIATARKLDARKLLEFWFSDKTDASSDFGKTVRGLLVFVAFYTGSSNAQAILKEVQMKARGEDPQTLKKAEILLKSLPFLPKRFQTNLDKSSTMEVTPQELRARS